eukprot:COSAG02_NODE_9649_length_2151_cov_11.023556_3_plen_73_part_00
MPQLKSEKPQTKSNVHVHSYQNQQPQGNDLMTNLWACGVLSIDTLCCFIDARVANLSTRCHTSRANETQRLP